MTEATLAALLAKIRACTLCQNHLPLGPNPVLRAAASAIILIVGQAPGRKVHQTSIPWNDASGKRLREWLDLTPAQFYDEQHMAIVPAGFCYPGRGPHGDNPPRPECAATWRQPLLAELSRIESTLLIGQYAQALYLGTRRKRNLTETVRAWETYAPKYFPLPHPSPRNDHWLKRNPWFEETVIPQLRQHCQRILRSGE